jgi:hypothetical protein
LEWHWDESLDESCIGLSLTSFMSSKPKFFLTLFEQSKRSNR